MKRKQKGFTIVELVIVIAVIGVLTAILVPTFTSLSNKARETATQSNLTNAYKSYQVEALSSGGSIKYLEKEEIYFSNEKNSTMAKDDVYHYADGKWKKAKAEDLYELNTVYDGFDYQASKFSGFYGYTAIEKLDSLSIVNPNGSDTIARYTSVSLVAQPEPAGASKEVNWTTTDAEKVSVSADGVINTCGEVGQSATITATSVVDPSKTASITVTIGAAPSVSAEEVKSIELPQFVSEYNANSTNLDDPALNNAAMAHAKKGPNVRSAIRRGVFYTNENGTRDTYKIGVRNTFKFPYLSRTSNSMSGQGVAYCGPFLNYEISEYNGAEFVATSKVTTDGYNINFNNDYLSGGTFGDVFKLRIYNSRINYEFIFESFDGYNVYKAEELCLFDNRDLTEGRLNFQDGSEIGYNSKGEETSVFVPGVDYWKDSRNGISSDDVKGIALHSNLVLKSYMIPDGLKYTKEDIETYISHFKSDFNKWSKKRTSYYTGIYGDYTFDGKSELIDSLRDDTALFYRTTNGEDFRFEGNYFSVDASELKPVYSLRTSNNPDPILMGNLDTKWKAESHLALFGANLTNNNDTTTGSDQLPENSVMRFTSESNKKFLKPTRGGNISINNALFVGNGDLSDDDRYGGGLIMFKSSAVTMTFNNDIVYKSYMGFMPQPCWYIVSDQIKQVNGVSDYHAWETKFVLNRVKCYRSYNIMFSAYGTTGNELNKCYFEDAGGPLLMIDELNYGVHSKYSSGSVDREYYHTASIDVTDSYLRNYVQGTESWFVQYEQARTLLAMIKLFGEESGVLYKNSRIHGDGKNVLKYQNGVPVFNFIGIDVSTSANVAYNYVQSPEDGHYGDALVGHIQINNTDASSSFALDMTTVAQSPVAEYAQIMAQKGMAALAADKTPDPALVAVTSGGGHAMFADDTGENVAYYVPEAIATALKLDVPLVTNYVAGTELLTGNELIDGYLNGLRDGMATGDFMSLYINMAPPALHYFGVLFGLM